MGRAPCCDKASVKKGPWSPEEDRKLKEYIHKNGTGGNWIALPHKAGLKRCGKSCRLRWLNYLRPNIKHGDFSDDEDRIICNLFATIGSRWSIIAAQLPGRTDNDIKNYWNTKLKKKLMHGLQAPYTTHNHHSTAVSVAAAAAVASPEAAAAAPIMSLQHLSSPHDYSHLYTSGGSFGPSNSTTYLLSAAAVSHGGLLLNSEQQATTCLDSGGGHGIYFDEPCATTISSSVVHGHELGAETFIFGGFQSQEDHHHHKVLLLAGSGGANQLDEQYNFAASCCYDEEKAPPLVSLTVTGGANGAGGTSTSSSFFYDGTYSEETATTTRAGAQ